MTGEAMTDEKEAPCVAVYGTDGGGPFVLVSDHAGRAVPSYLGDLGVSAEDRARHIGWDIGIDGVGRALAQKLQAVLIEQVYSRLVIDCNRAPGHPTSYHARITQELDARLKAGRPTVVVALHSFTPEMGGLKRPWQVGLLHNHDKRLAVLLMELLRKEGLTVGDNEPYALTDTSDYTVPTHGEKRQLPHVEIEIRQDLIDHPAGQEEWAARLARLLPQAWALFCQTYGVTPGAQADAEGAMA